MEIDVPDESKSHEPLNGRNAFLNVSSNAVESGVVSNQSDALLDSTIQKFRSQTSSYNSSPEQDKKSQQFLKGLSKVSSPVKSPNATPKASPRSRQAKKNSKSHVIPKEDDQKAPHNTSVTSKRKPLKSIEDEIQNAERTAKVETENLEKAIGKMEVVKIDNVSLA